MDKRRNKLRREYLILQFIEMFFQIVLGGALGNNTEGISMTIIYCQKQDQKEKKGIPKNGILNMRINAYS